jgi:uncharacterized protein YjdB
VDAGGGTWSSANLTIATIDMAAGIATGVSAGSVSIDYTLPSGCSSTASLLVNPVPMPISRFGRGMYGAHRFAF